MQETTIIGIFFIGLTTGGLSCLAVQGGLLAATIAQREEEKLKEHAKKIGNLLPVVVFLAAKLFAYTILGLLLGWFGSLFELSLTAKVVMQFVVIAFMLGTAMALLEAHPIFRYFIIQPPKAITRKIRSITRSGDLFAPGLLGAFTVFIPCGATQFAMGAAILSGSALSGAGMLFAFVLGTAPLFFIFGFLTSKLGEFWRKKFLKVVAYAIILLSLYNLDNALSLSGSPFTFSGAARASFCSVAYCETQKFDQTPVSEATINIQNSGYSPNQLTVKAGSKVTLTLVNNDGYTCAQAFTIPSLKLQKIVAPNTTETITFTAPKQKGQLAFMCSMGMYRGVINVN